MTNLKDFSECQFDAVVCIFAIFFADNMKKQIEEMWRLVKPGGKLAVTTWGPKMFEPAYSHWNSVLKRYSPDLLSSYNPWDKISNIGSLRKLFEESSNSIHLDIKEEMAYQSLNNPEDWWTIALGSGFRWIIDQFDPILYVKIREANTDLIKENRVKVIETNALYAIAEK